ncbi:hypothetical protein PROFUN_12513 [Planoprotostelium fungivorum]|uniref:Uncharacterized protein n=1 Tax=Planoprotostelium fungivorum TaxID=1890364 RepID=A0A2P6MS15_9EUKA|nr:hypothetical protein PROFUN_12513 [Planoprotostelium fungivorum]
MAVDDISIIYFAGRVSISDSRVLFFREIAHSLKHPFLATTGPMICTANGKKICAPPREARIDPQKP